MRPSDQLAQFVRDALIQGRSRADIEAALARAGWTANETASAVGAWADDGFSPPVPRPRPFVSAKEAFFYGLMFISLAMTTWHLAWLSFSLIDWWVPQDGQLGDRLFLLPGMRWSIATLVVFLPLFVLVNGRTQSQTRSDPGKRRSLVRKWFGYITLFIAAIALLGDLIAVIYALLNGDLTLRFAAKTVVVALIAGAVFAYFRSEMDDSETR